MIMPRTASEAHASHLALASRDLREAALAIDTGYCRIIAERGPQELAEITARAVALTETARFHLDELLACLVSEKRRLFREHDGEDKP